MNKCYGISISQIQSVFTSVTIEVKVVTVFSSAFTSAYGLFFADQIKTIGSQFNSQASFAFNGDFSCSAGFDKLITNSGKITAINNQYVDINSNGQQNRFMLGSCSRFEGQGVNFLPKVGLTCQCLGAKNTNKNSFNLHSASCY
jgi:hypothetical protein